MLFGWTPTLLLRTQVESCTVELYQVRSLRQLRADALMVPSNRLLWMGARVAKRVRDEAGDLVEEEARRHAPLPPGGVVATGGGMLRVRLILHVNILNEFQIATQDLLTTALDNAFIACEQAGASRVLIPDFTDQLEGWSADRCAQVILGAIRRNARRVRQVLIACWEQEHADAYRQVLSGS
ncbi:MAG: hypothetical protein C4335_08095 [Armatimonadota bacterium]|mgnify:CR=1 FL=1